MRPRTALLTAALLLAGGAAVAAARSEAAPRQAGPALYVGVDLRPTHPDLASSVSRDEQMVFFPDGTFLGRLPQEGLVWLDRARSLREYPRHWGAYAVDGDRVVLRYNGGGEIVARQDDRGVLTIPGRATLVRVPPVDGLRLEGTFARRANDPADVYAPIIFRADGTFEDRGAMRDLGLVGPNGLFLQPPPGRGRYEIGAHTLLLRYADGSWLGVSIFTFDPRTSIFLNRVRLDRRG